MRNYALASSECEAETVSKSETTTTDAQNVTTCMHVTCTYLGDHAMSISAKKRNVHCMVNELKQSCF